MVCGRDQHQEVPPGNEEPHRRMEVSTRGLVQPEALRPS